LSRDLEERKTRALEAIANRIGWLHTSLNGIGIAVVIAGLMVAICGGGR
jgi:hypothetical protein